MAPAIRSTPAQQRAPGGPNEVGFTFRLQSYRPDSPCVVPGSFMCVREDEHLWAKHANEWVDALARRAQNGSQRDAATKLAKQIADIMDKNCWLACTSGVHALVAISQHAKALAESWGQPVTEIDPEWGWSFPIPWGVPDWFKDAKKAWKKGMSLYAMAPFLIIAFLLLNNRRKGSWI